MDVPNLQSEEISRLCLKLEEIASQIAMQSAQQSAISQRLAAVESALANQMLGRSAS